MPQGSFLVSNKAKYITCILKVKNILHKYLNILFKVFKF